MGDRRGNNPHIEDQMDSILDFIKQQPDAKVSRRGDRVAVPFDVEVVISDSPPSQQLIKFYNALDKEREQANFQIMKSADQKGKRTFHGYANLFSLAMPTIKDQYGREVKMSKYITAVMTAADRGVRDMVEKLLKPDPDTGKLVLIQNDGKKIPADEARARYRNIIKIEIEKLIKQYNEIPEVEELRSAKPKRYYIIFSKHPYDIAGMSTDRGWTSCMNLYQGSNASYIQYDIEVGTMVAYLVKEEDLNIKNPTARIAIKPYVNITDIKDVLYEPEEKTYGTARNEFWLQVNRLVTAAQPNKSGTFKLIDTLYCDSKARITKYSDPKLPAKIERLLQNKQQASTIDEANYLLTNYYQVPSGDFSKITYSDQDKLYIDAPLYIVVPPALNYSPVAINYCTAFIITNPVSYDSFPVDVTDLVIHQPNKSDFVGLNTEIRNRLSLYGGDINNFNGLLPGVRNITVSSKPQTKTVIRSFRGLPSTVNIIDIPLNMNNTSLVLDMTLEEMIADLKPVGLINLNLYLDVDYLNRLIAVDAASSFAGKFMDSLYEKMKSIPMYHDGDSIRKGSQYYRLMGWLSRQLPTIMSCTQYRAGHINLQKLPEWAYPENW